MKLSCTFCKIAAWAAIVTGVVLIVLTLPGWAYLVLLAAALIAGGCILLRS